MRKWKKKAVLCLLIGVSVVACKKDFLDKKPNTNIVSPTSLDDFQNLLDNYAVVNITAALPQMASDEYYFINNDALLATATKTARNSYLWAIDIYNGESNIQDWNAPYVSIFYANSVLEGLQNVPKDASNLVAWNNIKGWALYLRSYEFFDLVKNFSPAYDGSSSSKDLGVPLRLTPGIDKIIQRSSVQQTYDRIIEDLQAASVLLLPSLQTQNKNRPSKVATMGLLSRIYLYMRKYDKAELYADSCLLLYNKLIDYNIVSQTSSTPFTNNNEETIFTTNQVIKYSGSTGYGVNSSIAVDTNLIKSYDPNDLRLPIYFVKNSLGNYNKKRGYIGSSVYPYTGIATDEIYLIKAECLARRNQVSDAMKMLNKLLINRYLSGTFVPLIPSSKDDALSKIFQERKKELVWRGIRWSDLKRLNKEGRSITLKRVINGQTYILSPNDPRYIFPIPDDEITLSGIQQNNRN